MISLSSTRSLVAMALICMTTTVRSSDRADELLSKGSAAYNSKDYVTALKCLFAFQQLELEASQKVEPQKRQELENQIANCEKELRASEINMFLSTRKLSSSGRGGTRGTLREDDYRELKHLMEEYEKGMKTSEDMDKKMKALELNQKGKALIDQ